MRHFPGARLIAVGTGSQRPYRANVYTHATLFALKMVAHVRSDDRAGAAVLDSQRRHIHGFIANAYTAVAQDAARTIKEHYGRPLLLLLVVLDLHVFRFRRAIGERHVLQFALPAGVAYRAVEGMIAKQ